MNEHQFKTITEWQRETFPDSTVRSILSHLQDEVFELKIACLLGFKCSIKQELADCFILLFGAADSCGLTHSDIISIIEEKMIVNRKRKWGTPDEYGIVRHIDEGI